MFRGEINLFILQMISGWECGFVVGETGSLTSKENKQLDSILHAYNPSTWKVEADEL